MATKCVSNLIVPSPDKFRLWWTFQKGDRPADGAGNYLKVCCCIISRRLALCPVWAGQPLQFAQDIIYIKNKDRSDREPKWVRHITIPVAPARSDSPQGSSELERPKNVVENQREREREQLGCRGLWRGTKPKEKKKTIKRGVVAVACIRMNRPRFVVTFRGKVNRQAERSS